MAGVRHLRRYRDRVTGAAEYFADEEPDFVRGAYGITADTTDDELPAIAERLHATEGVTLVGCLAYLRQLRDHARDVERAGLQEIATELWRLTAQRDVLLARVSEWGDPAEVLAALVGLSPEAVRAVLNRRA